MDDWLALGIFLLGAGSGALLTRIAQRGLLERHSLLAVSLPRIQGSEAMRSSQHKAMKALPQQNTIFTTAAALARIPQPVSFDKSR